MIQITEEIVLNDAEKDALKETANVGAGNASIALSKLVNKKVNISISDIDFVSAEKAVETMNMDEKTAIGISTSVTGDLSGNMILVLPLKSALDLSCMISGNKAVTRDSLTDTDGKTLQDIGNTISNSYLSSLGDFFGMQIGHEDSIVVSDHEEAYGEIIKLNLQNAESEYGILIKTNFDVESTDIKGEFMLLLTIKKIENILEKIR